MRDATPDLVVDPARPLRSLVRLFRPQRTRLALAGLAFAVPETGGRELEEINQEA